MGMNIRKKFSAQIMIVMIFLGTICFSIFTGFIFQITKLKEYESEIVSLNNQISETKSEIKRLKEENDSRDLEQIARERLNMVRPNETIYIDVGRGGN